MTQNQTYAQHIASGGTPDQWPWQVNGTPNTSRPKIRAIVNEYYRWVSNGDRKFETGHTSTGDWIEIIEGYPRGNPNEYASNPEFIDCDKFAATWFDWAVSQTDNGRYNGSVPRGVAQPVTTISTPQTHPAPVDTDLQRLRETATYPNAYALARVLVGVVERQAHHNAALTVVGSRLDSLMSTQESLEGRVQRVQDNHSMLVARVSKLQGQAEAVDAEPSPINWNNDSTVDQTDKDKRLPMKAETVLTAAEVIAKIDADLIQGYFTERHMTRSAANGFAAWLRERLGEGVGK